MKTKGLLEVALCDILFGGKKGYTSRPRATFVPCMPLPPCPALLELEPVLGTLLPPTQNLSQTKKKPIPEIPF